VTINTDDPGIFDTDMIQEYEILVNKFGFTEAEFNKANEIAFQASFVPAAKKNAAWKS
jgi:adenosine deaminase